MKKIFGVLIMAALLSSPAWGGETYTFKIDNDGAAFIYEKSNDRIAKGAYEIARIRPRSKEDRLWAQRVETLDRRLVQQLERIRQGRQSGDLTRQEGRRLEADQRQLRAYFYAAISDGWISEREWRSLTIMLDQASDNIYRFRHNRRLAKNDSPLISPEQRWRFGRGRYR